ncbi:MAG: type II toxin-antitoxin system HicA family toxin [Trueperaceae bacterium]
MGSSVRSRHRRTLEKLFRRPPPSDVAWRDVVALIVAIGGEVRSGTGSVRAVSLRGRDLVVREPHPSSELPKGMVVRLCRFLTELGEEPR